MGNLQSPGNKEAALDKYNNQNEDLSRWAQQQNKQEREETTNQRTEQQKLPNWKSRENRLEKK